MKNEQVIDAQYAASDANEVGQCKTSTADSLLGRASERTLRVHGNTYELCLMAQVLKDIVIVDPSADPGGVARQVIDLQRISGPPQGLGQAAVQLLYDLRGYPHELVWGADPPNTREQRSGPASNLNPQLHLNAPGMIFKNIRRGQGQGVVELIGNFDHAHFKDCKLPILELVAGSFKNLDLSDSAIQNLYLNMDAIDADGLVLPAKLYAVRFGWRVMQRLNAFDTGPGYGRLVLDSWHSANQCDSVAKYMLNQERRITRSVALQMLRSSGITIRGVLRRCRRHHGDVVVAAALIARRNQLRSGLGRTINHLAVGGVNHPTPRASLDDPSFTPKGQDSPPECEDTVFEGIPTGQSN